MASDAAGDYHAKVNASLAASERDDGGSQLESHAYVNHHADCLNEDSDHYWYSS